MWLASNPTELGLTADQTRRLQGRADALERQNAPLQLQIDSLWAGRDARTLTWPDRHALMSATRAVRQAMHDNHASAVADMRAALTPGQQAVMDRRGPMAMGRGAGGMAMGRRGMMGRGRGMGGGMHGGGMRMGHHACPGCRS